MEPSVRYATTSDGVSIAYQVEGEGPPMLAGSQLFESFSVGHLIPKWEAMYQTYSNGRTVIRYDPRGIGLSQREVDDVSVEGGCRDLEAVVDASGFETLSLLCAGMNVLPGVLYASRHHDRVAHLALNNGFVRTLDLMAESALRAMADLARSSWRAAARTFSPGGSVEETDAWADAMVASTSGEHVARTLLALIDVNATSVLADITCPTVVLHYLENPSVPVKCGQDVASGIPGARFVGIRATSREDRMKSILAAHEPFLPKATGGVKAADSASLRTVLFTDLVGHTEMMQRLGDERGRDVLREHERITRETLAAHGGAEVKTMGDGFMASFGSVTRAMDCAIALQRAFAAHDGEPLLVRVGLNAGEPIEEEGDLFGSTVILASRIAAQAGVGEILIPEPLRHLLSGKSYVYSDRGQVALKGFEDAVRLYEVRWQE